MNSKQYFSKRNIFFLRFDRTEKNKQLFVSSDTEINSCGEGHAQDQENPPTGDGKLSFTPGNHDFFILLNNNSI